MAAKRTRRINVATLSLLAAVTLGVSSCTTGPIAEDNNEVNTIGAELATSIDEAVANAMQLSGSSGAIIGVWTSSGEYVQTFGEGISTGSPIRAAQASQPVMCALLLDLAADGRVPLDREISEDLPRQVGLEGITYEQLCTATSGLAGFRSAAVVDLNVNNPTRPWSDRELLSYSLAHSPLAEPGAEQHVSDTNALVLARALRQATSTPVTELLRERIFSPLEMRASYYPQDMLLDMTLPGDAMTGTTYASSGGAPVCTVPGEEEGTTVPAEPHAVPEVSPSMLDGAGATVTTITDLKRFYEGYLSGVFGEDADITKTLSVPPPPEPAEGEAAAEPAEGEEAPEPVTDGWTFGLEKLGNLYGMSGAMTGTLTASYHDPDAGFTVVAALNNSSAGAAFAKSLAFQLAALADAGVTWTAEDQSARLAELAVCQPPAEEAPAE